MKGLISGRTYIVINLIQYLSISFVYVPLLLAAEFSEIHDSRGHWLNDNDEEVESRRVIDLSYVFQGASSKEGLVKRTSKINTGPSSLRVCSQTTQYCLDVDYQATLVRSIDQGKACDPLYYHPEVSAFRSKLTLQAHE